MNKIKEAISILKDLGMPRAQQNERSGLTLLALLNLKKKIEWKKSQKRIIRIHDILLFIKKEYKKHYAENTRETIRRQTLQQFEQGGIAVRNPDDPLRTPNHPYNVYQISNEALKVIKTFGSSKWKSALNNFIRKKGKLIDRYEKRKIQNTISVDLPSGASINFSPGKHNRLQIEIINEFRKRFCPHTDVIYVGDAAKKLLYVEEKILNKLNISITQHGKLPDVVLYDFKKNIIIFIEAVTSHGPLSPKRQIELEETLAQCKAKRIYVSAFPDFKEFKRHIDNIAWETEVWLESNPDHMIHFNGPKFFNIYNE